jgi:energy-coupling factor transport system permease protein
LTHFGAGMNDNLNARAWTVWVLAAAGLTMTARNPLYSLIILLVARLVTAQWGCSASRFPIPFWRLGLIMLLFSVLFNGLFVSIGSSVLFRLPDWPLIGGPVTLEAVVFGLSNGLLLWTLLAVFLTLNAVVPVYQLARLTPRAFHDLGVVVLIALTYLPETARHLRRIREAQAVRGLQLRGWRDWRPIFLPLLIGGLERAMQLAETMVARGYGATLDVAQRGQVRLLLAMTLLAAFGGWLALLWQRPLLGGMLVGSAALILAGLLWRLGRRAPTSRYRPAVWQWADTLVVVAAVVPMLLVWLPWPGLDYASLYYSPYPTLVWPAFDPVLGLALAFLSLPVFLRRGESHTTTPASAYLSDGYHD